MKKDPVCGMMVKEADSISVVWNGTIQWFCSEGCRDRFLETHRSQMRPSSYDVIIIGGGPAGLTAAVYAAILKMNAFVIAKDLGGQAVDSSKIENYMGYDFITGPELIAKFRDQLLHSNYIDHVMSSVEKIEQTDAGFRITTSELKQFNCAAVIFATGMKRRKLQVPGEEEFQRRGVFYGNVEDAGFIHGEDIAVIGGGNSAMQIIEHLHPEVRSIHIVSDMKLTADPRTVERVKKLPQVTVYEGYTVDSLSGNKTLTAVNIRKTASSKTRSIPVKGVFVGIGLKPNSALVKDLTDLNEKGEIAVGRDCSTRTPGLFAAGDVTNVYGKRIIIACAEGAKAALAARNYIRSIRRVRTD